MNHITNIQKFSIHDGDGIRTTVFFKGCPLKCIWCHNPETQRYEREMQFDAEKCTGCGSCVKACPENALHMNGRVPAADTSKCTFCGKCTIYCPKGLREVIGKDYSPRELVKELKKDLMFYEESGGGVTLSGGEVMTMDSDYILDVVKRLHHEGISVTIDTCGFAPYENFEKILPYVDTFLYDIKTIDSELHKEYTGFDNKLIFDNLAGIARAGARIYLRIPMIDGVSGSEKNIQATIKFLKDNDITPAQVNLLPYHNTGSHKYAKVGMIYQGEELRAPSDEDMDKYVQMFKEAGFNNTHIGG